MSIMTSKDIELLQMSTNRLQCLVSYWQHWASAAGALV
jgi:hypothetical protein